MCVTPYNDLMVLKQHSKVYAINLFSKRVPSKRFCLFTFSDNPFVPGDGMHIWFNVISKTVRAIDRTTAKQLYPETNDGRPCCVCVCEQLFEKYRSKTTCFVQNDSSSPVHWKHCTRSGFTGIQWVVTVRFGPKFLPITDFSNIIPTTFL